MGLLNDMSSLITSETNKCIGDIPDSPNNLICLFGTDGYDSQHQLGVSSAPIFEQPTFQVYIRDGSYLSGNTRAEVIKDTLNGLVNQTINGNKYLSIFLMGDINPLGKDEKNRSEFTINFKTRVKRN